MLSLTMASIFYADFSTLDILESDTFDSFEKLQIPTQTQLNTELTYSRSARESLIESNEHGGSWLDSFEDDDGIDWAMSDKIKIFGGNVKNINSFNLDKNTIALWHFDEGFGTVAVDESKNNYHGILGGDGEGQDLPSWTTGKFGNALEFDGIDDFVDLFKDTEFHFTPGNEYTIELWIKPNRTNNASEHQIIGDAGAQTGSRLYFKDGVLIHELQKSGNYHPMSYSNISFDEWLYVAVQIFIDKQTLFINGEQNVTVNVNSYSKGTNPFDLGRESFLDRNYFNGTIDEVRISNIVRSDLEIKDNFENYTKNNRRINKGFLTSKSIEIPSGMNLDTIVINKTQPKNCFMNITILNATNKLPIPNAAVYLGQGEYDISYIDSFQYSSIKLNVSFHSYGFSTTILHYLGVSWRMNNCWRDTFFRGNKIDTLLDLNALDGSANLIKCKQIGPGIDESAVAIFHFDEGSGTTAHDATENNNHGTIHDATWTTGQFGNALNFDGSDDYVALPNGNPGDPFHTNFKEYSLLVWFKLQDTTTRQALHEQGAEVNGYNMYIYNGKLYAGAYSYDNGYNGDWISTPITTGWHCGVSVYSVSNGYFKLYLDGEERISVNDGGEIAYHPGESAIGAQWEYSIYEGTIDFSNLAHSFNGIIDEVAFYNRALTKNEIMSSVYKTHGNMTSKTIKLSDNHYWDTLMIKKTEYSASLINITILDAIKHKPIENFKNITESVIDISSIDPHKCKSIRLEATFETRDFESPILHDWSVNWTENTPPKINKIISKPQTVYRTKTTQLSLNGEDTCDSLERLNFNLSYTSIMEKEWSADYLSNLHFVNDSWFIDFSPTKKADLGYYSFKIICIDSFDEVGTKIFSNILEVLNNPPTKPNVTISPDNPKTIDDFQVIAYNATDIEDEPIHYYYEWYKNNELQPELITDYVDANYTFKNEQWKCVVTPNDGNDNGTSAEVEITIQNTPPEILDQEDLTAQVGIPFELKLNASDVDDDLSDLTWTLHSIIDFLTLEPGTGILTGIPTLDDLGYFFINISVDDGDGGIDWLQFMLNVIKVNRPPIITTLDIHSATTDEYYYMDYNATDDFTNYELFKWALNTNANWLKIDSTTGELSGTPSKTDIGWFWVNLSVMDDDGAQTYHYFIINVSKPPNEIPKLMNFQISPKEGNTDTEFTFSVYYSDADLDPPVIIKVVIDGVELDLELQPGEIAHDGKYEFTTKLTKGEHKYYFIASDGRDTINSNTFQTPYIKNAKADQSTGEFWTWAILLFIIIIIIIYILLFLMLKRKKKQESKQEAVLLQQPQFTKPDLSPPFYNQQLGGMQKPLVLQNNIYNQPEMDTSMYNYSSLPPTIQPSFALPPAQEEIYPNILPQDEIQDTQVFTSETEPLTEADKTLIQYIEPTIAEQEYPVNEAPQLIERSEPLFAESMPTIPEPEYEPEIKDEVIEPEPSTQGSLEIKTVTIQQPIETQQPLSSDQKPKTPQPQPQPGNHKENKFKFLEVS